MRAVLLAVLAAVCLVSGQSSILTYNFAGTWSSPFGGSTLSYICQNDAGRVDGLLGGAASIQCAVNGKTCTGYWASGGGNSNTNWGAVQFSIVDMDAGTTLSGIYWYGQQTTIYGGPFPLMMNRLSFNQPTSSQCWSNPSTVLGAFQQQLTVGTGSNDKPTLAFCLDAKNQIGMRGSAVNWYPNSDGSIKQQSWGFFGSSPDKGMTFQGTWKYINGDVTQVGDSLARGVNNNQVNLLWWQGTVSNPNVLVGASTWWGPQQSATPSADIPGLCTKSSAASVVVSVAVLLVAALVAAL